jgi:hypothetical protein
MPILSPRHGSCKLLRPIIRLPWPSNRSRRSSAPVKLSPRLSKSLSCGITHPRRKPLFLPSPQPTKPTRNPKAPMHAPKRPNLWGNSKHHPPTTIPKCVLMRHSRKSPLVAGKIKRPRPLQPGYSAENAENGFGRGNGSAIPKSERFMRDVDSSTKPAPNLLSHENYSDGSPTCCNAEGVFLSNH